nr:hypothetical protein [Pseudogemmobacter hezensis]
MENPFVLLRCFVSLVLSFTLVACGARGDLTEPPMPMGDFVLGHNIVVTENMQKVPISRDASGAEWEKAMKTAVDDRFGQKRYPGSRVYNIGISVDGFALAPPGIPIVAAPKSVLAVTANIWDDASGKKLNSEGQKFTVFESLSGDTVIGSGLTRTKAQQMEALSFNAVLKIEGWLQEHPDWFGMTKEQQSELLAVREAGIEKARDSAKAAPLADQPPDADPQEGAAPMQKKPN